MKNISMSDIATLAGVSLKTVSRVINNSPNVSLKTKEKVMAVIEKHGYSVNVAAQGLRGRKTKTIIVFIDKHNGNYWMWHNSIIGVIINESKKRGYKIVVSPSSATGVVNDDSDGFHLLKSRFADGAIIFDNKDDDSRINYLKSNDIPFVVVGKSESDYSVDIDNYQVGFIGGDFLLKQGYKSIAMFTGNSDFIVNRERCAGFEASMADSNADFRTFSGIDSIERAYTKSIEVLKNFKADAFFVSGDERAIGVYKAIQESELNIPDDIAVLGVDNISLSKYLHPSLSTIDQFMEELGRKTLNTLVDLLSGEEIKSRRTVIQPALVSRDSTL